MVVRLETISEEHGELSETLTFKQLDAFGVDADSCFFGKPHGGTFEGMDEVARKLGLFKQISEITTRYLNGAGHDADGRAVWDRGFIERLLRMNLTSQHISWLTEAYRNNITTDAPEVVRAAQYIGIEVIMISAGIEDAILEPAIASGLRRKNIFGQKLIQKDGVMVDMWRDTPLAFGDKKGFVELLRNQCVIKGNFGFAGDGKMDMYAAGHGLRIAFAGHIRRPGVAELADVVITTPSFAAILPLIAGRDGLHQLLASSEHYPVVERGLMQLTTAEFNPRGRIIKAELQPYIHLFLGGFRIDNPAYTM